MMEAKATIMHAPTRELAPHAGADRSIGNPRVRPRILLLGDEQHTRGLLRSGDAGPDARVELAQVESGMRATGIGLAHDLVILALPCRGGDGLQLCRCLRDGGLTAPLLVFDARARNEEMLALLDAGADAYATPAMHGEELRARIRALVRRPGRSSLAAYALPAEARGPW